MTVWVIQGAIGLLAGILGGLLGVGGSVIIIPGLILYFSYTAQGYSGHQQHLVQAAAMICNVFIAAPAVLAHRRAGALMKPVVARLIPAALIGIVAGVTWSNASIFARQNGRYLAVLLAVFLGYVVLYNLIRLFSRTSLTERFDPDRPIAAWKVYLVGLPMGLTAGLLGIGGGAICVPAQQLLLRLPLRRAIANSAATILFTALAGAIYKNATLGAHHVSPAASLHLALLLVPTAVIGSYCGGRLTYRLDRRLLRIAFIVLMSVVAVQTFRKAYRPRGGPSADSPTPVNRREAVPPGISLGLPAVQQQAELLDAQQPAASGVDKPAGGQADRHLHAGRLGA